MRLSSSTVNNVSRIQDYGNNFPSGQQATHSLTLYRHSSGALVFSAGTVQWSWGLDDMHDGSAGSSSAGSASSTPAQPPRPNWEPFLSFHLGEVAQLSSSAYTCSKLSPLRLLRSKPTKCRALADNRMRQATVNLLADMGVRAGYSAGRAYRRRPSTDTTAPTSTIMTPASGATSDWHQT